MAPMVSGREGEGNSITGAALVCKSGNGLLCRLALPHSLKLVGILETDFVNILWPVRQYKILPLPKSQREPFRLVMKGEEDKD